MPQTVKTLCVVGQRGKADTTRNRKRAKQATFSQLPWEGLAFIQTGSARKVSRGEADILGLLGSTSCAPRDQKDPYG